MSLSHSRRSPVAAPDRRRRRKGKADRPTAPTGHGGEGRKVRRRESSRFRVGRVLRRHRACGDLAGRSRALTQAAFDAIAATLPLGSVGYEDGTNEKGERLIWLAPHVVNRLRAMRGPKESHSDAIIRFAGQEALATRRG